MIFRLAAATVTLGMLIASGFASYAAITMITGASSQSGASVGRLATPVGGEPNFVAPTPAVTSIAAPSPTSAH